MKTLVLVKPDAVRNKYLPEVLEFLESNPMFKIEKIQTVNFTPELAKEFYAEHLNKEFFPRLSEFMCSGPCVAIVLSGVDAVNRWRNVIGPTDPANGQFNNHLRARYGTSVTENALHGSATPTEAIREIGVIFDKKQEQVIEKEKTLKFIKKDSEAILPKRLTPGSAGLDIYALEDVDLFPLTPVRVRTGWGVQIPEGLEGQIRSRSGLGSKGVAVVNAPGTIDSDYRGEVEVPLIWWIDQSPELDSVYKIKKGDRIAQLVIAPIEIMDPKFVKNLDKTNRGTGGFGSTGK